LTLLFQIIIGVVYAILVFLLGKSITRILKRKTIRPKRFDAIKGLGIIAVFIITLKKLAEGITILLNKNNYSIDLFDNDSIVVYIIISVPFLVLIYLGIKNNTRRTYQILTEWITTWGILIVFLFLILCFGAWAFTDKL
jgi:hypothetical protein